MTVSRAALLQEVLTAFQSTPTVEAYIHAEDSFIDGCTDGETITINPVPAAVETILHELIHCLHPRWSEAYVTRRAQSTLAHMGDEQARKLYRAYQRRKRVTRAVKLYCRPR